MLILVADVGESAPRAPGRGLAIASLALVPGVLVAFLAGELVGALILRALGLDEGESLRAAGAAGVLAGIPVLAILCLPQAVGLWLGLRARRLGQGALATTGIILNGLLLAYLAATSAAGLLLS